jgi:Ca2+-binding RTX toxin-like protein
MAEVKGTSSGDVLRGGPGGQVISGFAGRDNLFGGRGDDYIVGGLGNDTLTGGLGSDTLKGGPGSDTFVFGANTFNTTDLDTILDFDTSSDFLKIAGGFTLGVNTITDNGGGLLTFTNSLGTLTIKFANNLTASAFNQNNFV